MQASYNFTSYDTGIIKIFDCNFFFSLIFYQEACTINQIKVSVFNMEYESFMHQLVGKKVYISKNW